MKKIFISILVITTTFIISCDKIEDPIQTGGSEGGDTTSIKRRILIEEFTGQICTACPDGAREIERLVAIYGDQLIPVSVHAGAFAHNGPDANEFTTTVGDDLDGTFGIQSWPIGLVSRVNNADKYDRFQWEPEINSIKDDSPIADVTITNSYNTATRNVSIQVDTEWLENGGSGVNYKLQVYVIEDHIIAYQLDNGTDVADYDHRHVLRGAVNTSWGTPIPTTTSSTTDTQIFNYTLNASWDETNCEVVAFIYKEGPDYEIMQANIEHIE